MAKPKKGESQYFNTPYVYGVFSKEFKEPIMVAPERHYCTEYIELIPKALRDGLTVRKLKPDEIKKYSDHRPEIQTKKSRRKKVCA